MKTYILERSQDELKNLTRKGCKEILSSLRVAHPKALSSKELIERTGVAEATVYSSISILKKENYIKEIGKVKPRHGRPGQNAIDIPTVKYVIEDGNYSISKAYNYKLSRGNVEYDTEFIDISERLLNKINLSLFFDNLLSVSRDIQSLIKDEHDKDFKKWAPSIGKEHICPNCKMNHEARDFLRAIFLRLLDKFETGERYTSHLIENENGPSHSVISVKNTITSKAPELKDMQKKGLIVRILSIKKNASNGKYDVLAIDKHKNYVIADIDTTLVSGEILPDSIVECFTDYGFVDPLGILNLELSKKDNDTIKRIGVMNTFPKTRDLIRKIDTIVYGKREEGEIFSIEGIIIQHKFLNSNNSSHDELASSVLLRDNTGMIPLKLDSRYSKKFHEGDKILVIGAVVNESLSLTAGHYSSVTKTGSVIITERNSPYQNEIYNKHLEVNSKVTEGGITIRLIDIILTSSETRAYLSIENERETDIHPTPYAHEFIAIQNKRQFIARDVSRSSINIPPGIEEKLVVWIEGVDPTMPIVSFRFKIMPTRYSGGADTIYFKFTVQIPH